MEQIAQLINDIVLISIEVAKMIFHGVIAFFDNASAPGILILIMLMIFYYIKRSF